MPAGQQCTGSHSLHDNGTSGAVTVTVRYSPTVQQEAVGARCHTLCRAPVIVTITGSTAYERLTKAFGHWGSTAEPADHKDHHVAHGA